MEFKGTKGKWEIKHSESKDAFNIVGTVVGGHYKIARVPYLVLPNLEALNERSKSEAHANAKLIKFSPLLLEALEHTLQVLYQCDCPEGLFEEYGNLFANYNNLIYEVKK